MNAFTNAVNQPLPLLQRPELEAREILYRRQSYWSVKDPLSLRYYQLRDEEYFILSLLDGCASLQVIQQRFQEKFAPRRIDFSQLNWFLGMLHREGLVVSAAANQGQQLNRRRRRTHRRQLWSSVSNVLAIRFRGINPSRLVERLYPFLKWAFSPWAVALTVLLMITGVALFMLELREIVQRLPTFGAFFSLHNVIWLAVALAVVKVLHEFGHALTCRHFGGQCRELGVMLLVFTPCLYCNVSDAWMIPNKWRRMAVSAAGIYVELALASVCLWLWWFSEPGAFNALCLNLVFVCSVGTLLFNGNPLLRYDGYFILADWCETPNLGQRAGQYVRNVIWKLCLGLESNTVPPDRRERPLLAIYALASWNYRIFITSAILWFLHASLKPFGLQSLAVVLGTIAIGGIVAMPLVEMVPMLRDPARRRKVRGMRLACTAVLIAMFSTVLLAVPLPFRIVAPVVVEPSDASPIYVTAPGILVDGVEEGDRLEPGQVVATLSNIELEKEVAELAAELAVQKMNVQTLTRQQSQATAGDVLGAGGRLPAAYEALADLENRLQGRLAQQDRLTLRTPVAGTVMPPRELNTDETLDDGELPVWSGTPLHLRNRGGTLEAGTRVCLIGDPANLVAQLVIDQASIRFVRTGQRVRICVDELPGRSLAGIVTEIARHDTEEPLPELVAKKLVAIKPGTNDAANLTMTSYQVRVDLEPYDAVVPLRASGRAVIDVDPQTLARRGYDFLCRTFRFQL